MEDPRVIEFQKWLESREKKTAQKESTSTVTEEVLSEAFNGKSNLRAIRDIISSAHSEATTRQLQLIFDRKFRLIGGEKK